MARIAGVDLPRQKRIEYGLTYIFGIGISTSRKILEGLGVDFNIRVKDLSESEISRIAKEIQEVHKVEGDLRRKST